MPTTQTAPAVVHSTAVHERTLKASPARVWAAFADPAQLRRWYAVNRPGGADEFVSDCRPGGLERLVYRLGDDTPFPGVAIVNEGQYLDVEEGKRILSASVMSIGGRHMSATLLTVGILEAEGGGTHLVLTHQDAFLPYSDGPQMREHGWRVLLDKMESTLEG